MKFGKSLTELAVEIDRQKQAKKDYLVDSQKLRMSCSVGAGLHLAFGIHTPPIHDIAHRQIGTHLKIPAVYYDRMQAEEPWLLCDNVNAWLSRSQGQRMIRTLDFQARAFLSDRYRIIDNDMVAEAVLPIISEWAKDGATVESAEITDRKLYIKVVLPNVQTEIAVGDVLQSGVVISNSEVGFGAVSVAPLLFRLVCRNGMIRNDLRQHKIHVGRTNESDANFNLYRDETIHMDDMAFLMKLQDVVRSTADSVHFERMVDSVRQAQGMEITGHVPEVVQLTTKKFGLNDTEGESVLDHLIHGGDLSLWGIASATTRMAQDVASYDRSTDLEGIGYEIVSLSPMAWKQLNEAATR